MSISTRSNMTNDRKRTILAFTGRSCSSLNQKLQDQKSEMSITHTQLFLEDIGLFSVKDIDLKIFRQLKISELKFQTI